VGARRVLDHIALDPARSDGNVLSRSIGQPRQTKKTAVNGNAYVDIVGVTGSIPVAPAILKALETLVNSDSGAFAFLGRRFFGEAGGKQSVKIRGSLR
jgi:hypothetical protein